MNASLPALVLEPQAGAADAAVIWLHGLGADGHDFEALVPELRLPASCRIRFIFPHAPVRPVTLNNGLEMRAWYDILGLDRDAQQDEAGIRASAAQIWQLIEQQRAAGIAAQRILLAGFSQGGAIVLHLGLRHPETLGGILALSTYLPLRNTVADELHPANRQTPLLMLHGQADAIISLDYAETSRDALQALGAAIEWKSYAGLEHSVSMEEILDMRQWFLARLGCKEA